MLLFLVLSCETSTKQGKPDFKRAALFGMIYNFDGQPVTGVRVSIDGTEGPLTDINGRFVLPDILYGKHSITMGKKGYENLSVEFTFLNKSQVLYAKMFSFHQLLKLAEDNLAERNWKRGHEYLERAKRLDPNNPILQYLYAVSLYKRKDFLCTEKILLNLLSSGYDEAYIHLLLADIYQYEMMNIKKAVLHLEAFLTLKTDYEIEKRMMKLSGNDIKKGF